MKVLVTGAAGFIGSAVCKALLERGDQVTSIDNLSDYYDVTLKKARLEDIVAHGRDIRANSFATFAFEKLDLSNRTATTRLN